MTRPLFRWVTEDTPTVVRVLVSEDWGKGDTPTVNHCSHYGNHPSGSSTS